MTRRRSLAALIAPPVGATVGCLGFIATGALVLPSAVEAPSWAASFAHWLGFYLFFGLPLAYLAELIVLALHEAPGGTTPPSFRRVLLSAVVLGGGLVGTVWGLVFGVSFGLLTIPSGALGGAAAGATFWLTGMRGEPLTPATSRP